MKGYHSWTDDQFYRRFERRIAQVTTVPTLTSHIPNRLVRVDHDGVTRRSDEGTSHTNQPRRLDVLQVWRTLTQRGRVGGKTLPYSVPYIIFALLLAAFPKIIKDIGNGEIALR